MAELRCPVCRKPFNSDQSGSAPFCSQRCRHLDLGRWLDEKYAMPIDPEEEPPEEFDYQGDDSDEE